MEAKTTTNNKTKQFKTLILETLLLAMQVNTGSSLPKASLVGILCTGK